MNKKWQTKTLAEIALVGAGNAAPQDESSFRDGTIPFFRTSDAGRARFGEIAESADYLNAEGAQGLRRFKKGTILFPKSGASTFLNHRVMLGVEGCVSSHLATITVDESQADPRFLLYYLSTIAAQDLIQDHAYPSLNLSTIGNLPICLPTLQEQRRIVRMLDEAYAGIATATSNTHNNLRNTAKLFHSYLNELFERGGVGWREAQFGDVVVQSRGGISIKSAEYAQHGMPVLTKGDVKPFGRIEHGGKFVSSAYVKAQRWPTADPGDLIVTTRDLKPSAPFLGSVARVPSDQSYLVNQGATFFKIDEAAVNADYVVFWCCSDRFREHVKSRKSGSTQVHIREADLFAAPMSFPPVEQQRAIVSRLGQIAAETQLLKDLFQQKLTALESLRKSFLLSALIGAP